MKLLIMNDYTIIQPLYKTVKMNSAIEAILSLQRFIYNLKMATLFVLIFACLHLKMTLGVTNLQFASKLLIVIAIKIIILLVIYSLLTKAYFIEVHFRPYVTKTGSQFSAPETSIKFDDSTEPNLP